MSRQAVINAIADTIAQYTDVSITDKGDVLEVSDRSGTFQIPIRTSKPLSQQRTTHR